MAHRFVLANTEVLHEKIQELSNRVRQLEDALADAHSLLSPERHPLLTDELLLIKRPLERERNDHQLAADEENLAREINEEVDALGSLSVFLHVIEAFAMLKAIRSISNGGRASFFGTTANSWVRLTRFPMLK